MKKSKFLALMLVAVLLVMSLAGCSKPAEEPAAGGETPAAPAEKITWKLGHLGNEEHIWNKTALKFAELVAKKTNGQIEIKVYPNESLGKEVENIDMIKTGAADMVISGESMQTWAPKAALMAVPYAFRDTAHMQAVIESELGDEIAAQIEEKVGLIPLYYHLRAPRNLTSNRPINTPADLNGFKMRVPNVPLFVDAWKAAGAAPQAMAFNEVFTALQQGVIEGRKVFGNIMKYIKMAASSNFGNMFSVVGASAFLPFLPMLPIQVLVNNLLYDFSQTTIPTDEVDQEWLVKPRKWGIQGLERFILLIGPISSIFDYLTFALMLFVFHSKDNPALFHTGWFVESLFTQTLIIHVIRTNKIPFIQSRASTPLMISSLLIVSIGAFLPFSPLASTLGFVPLPAAYWGYLAGMLVCYVALTQLAKTWFIRKFGE